MIVAAPAAVLAYGRDHLGEPKRTRQRAAAIHMVLRSSTRALVIETAGLALAATLTVKDVATTNQPNQPTPPKPTNIPSCRKLPQTIFNLEKRGGNGSAGGASSAGSGS